MSLINKINDYEKNPQQKKEKSIQQLRENSLKSCRQHLEYIAKTHAIDAKIHPIEHHSLIDRVALRKEQYQRQQQANLEQIINIAHPLCQDNTGNGPDIDWQYRFFDMAQNIHGEGMQQLWARILKQEILKPGSTSLKALALLETMTHREAQTLQRACALACSFGQEGTNKIITGFRQPEQGIIRFFKPDITMHLSLGQYKLPYTDLLVLMDLGLILRTELESGPLNGPLLVIFGSKGKTRVITPYKNASRLCYYRFSPTGNELAKLVSKQYNYQYFADLIALLSQAFEINKKSESVINEQV